MVVENIFSSLPYLKYNLHLTLFTFYDFVYIFLVFMSTLYIKKYILLFVSFIVIYFHYYSYYCYLK